MQHGVVRRVGERPEERLLQVVGVLEEGEGLVGVGGEDHPVEATDPIVPGTDLHPVGRAPDGADGEASVDAVAEALARASTYWWLPPTTVLHSFRRKPSMPWLSKNPMA